MVLILNKGNWNGNQIMTDTTYFNDMVNTSQNLNKAYGYLWWLNGKQTFMVPTLQTVFPGYFCPNAPADMISGIGSGGQFLNVVPSQNLVWLRMGEDPGSSNVPFMFNDLIWEYVNNLVCAATGLDYQDYQDSFVQLFPNPSNDILNLKSDKQILKVEVLNLHGQIVKSLNTQNKEVSVLISELKSGLYFVKAIFANGKIWTDKLIIE